MVLSAGGASLQDLSECGGEMTRLSETDDDAYLKQTGPEEELKSVDYDVHICSACGTTITEQFQVASTRYTPRVQPAMRWQAGKRNAK